MKRFIGFVAALALGWISIGLTAPMALAQDPDLDSCYVVWATPPGGGEPIEVEVCP